MCSKTTCSVLLTSLAALLLGLLSVEPAAAGGAGVAFAVDAGQQHSAQALAVRVTTPTIEVTAAGDRLDWRVRGRKRPSPDGSPSSQNYVSLRYGTFDPQGAPANGGFFGLRTGVELDHRLGVAFNLDYYRRSYTDETLIATRVDANGNVIETRATSLQTSSNLVPLGVSVSLRLPGSRTLTPFVGAGVSYQVLVNEISDFERGFKETNAYGGPGWQLFGGLMVPVTSQARVLGELTYNDATVSRSIDRYEIGLPVRESIDVSGFGARLGFEFHFD